MNLTNILQQNQIDTLSHVDTPVVDDGYLAVRQSLELTIEQQQIILGLIKEMAENGKWYHFVRTVSPIKALYPHLYRQIVPDLNSVISQVISYLEKERYVEPDGIRISEMWFDFAIVFPELFRTLVPDPDYTIKQIEEKHFAHTRRMNERLSSTYLAIMLACGHRPSDDFLNRAWPISLHYFKTLGLELHFNCELAYDRILFSQQWDTFKNTPLIANLAFQSIEQLDAIRLGADEIFLTDALTVCLITAPTVDMNNNQLKITSGDEYNQDFALPKVLTF